MKGAFQARVQISSPANSHSLKSGAFSVSQLLDACKNNSRRQKTQETNAGLAAAKEISVDDDVCSIRFTSIPVLLWHYILMRIRQKSTEGLSW